MLGLGLVNSLRAVLDRTTSSSLSYRKPGCAQKSEKFLLLGGPFEKFYYHLTFSFYSDAEEEKNSDSLEGAKTIKEPSSSYSW